MPAPPTHRRSWPEGTGAGERDPGDASGEGGPEPQSRLLRSPVMLLAGLGRLTAARLDEALGREGLSLRHLGALGHLRRDPGLSYSELGRRARVTVQSMQATVAQLEASGAVARRSAGGRGRTAQLEVTQAGLEALARVEVVVAQLEDQLLGRLSDDERAELTDVLARVLRAASAG